MPNSNEPAAEAHIVAALAHAFKFEAKDIYAPILQAKSFLSQSADRLARIDDILSKADLSSASGFLAGLQAVGGLLALAEGLSILGNAAQVGTAVVAVMGLSVSSGVAILIGIGFVALGAYLLYRGISALWPFIRARLEQEFGEGWHSFFGS